jgi:integrase
MEEDTLPAFRFPAVARQKVSAAFDGGMLSSDAGVLLLRGVEKQPGLAQRFSGCLKDKREALVPLSVSIKLLLEEIRGSRNADTVLVNSNGKPLQSGFKASRSAAMRRAWPEGWKLHFHDLRGTAATNFFRAGFTYREIAESVGWSEEDVERLIDRYVKRDEITQDRVRRMENMGTYQNENCKPFRKTTQCTDGKFVISL